ncbi:MAG TPA: prolyl oligopeptidase family serine peptidase [Acidimicrobiia bacterium]
MVSAPRWEQRFRTPTVALPRWARSAPDHLVYVSNVSGAYQVHAWDRETDTHRQITDHPIGVIEGEVTVDGDRVVFWQDETGSEAGRWYAQPFAGGEPVPYLAGVPEGWNQGLTQATGVVAAVISDADGFASYVAVDGGPAREVLRSLEWLCIGGFEQERCGLAGLSADGTMLALEHAEHGDAIHPALRVVDAATGETIADLVDDGLALYAAAWSPVPGDRRLAVSHERGGDTLPAIWDPVSGDWLHLDLDLEGPVSVADWWPDGQALLLTHNDRGRDRLYRYDLATRSVERLATPDGSIEGSRVRPDGSVWFELTGGIAPPAVVDLAGAKVLAAPGPAAPVAAPFVPWRFDNGQGDVVHGFYLIPEGEGPFPVIMRVHGGPNWEDKDRWHPEIAAYVDMGFAVGLVNYRGSTGYGRVWRDRLIGDIGGPELVDVNAGLADLVARGIADPSRAVIGGWSWGGYITLLELGKHPELWVAGIAGVPVGDYELGYEDLSPELQVYDRALIGGTPDQVPELMADRNPIYFVGDVVAPVIFLIGENDTRCPLRQAMAYVDKLAERGHPHELVMFDAGHGSYDVDEEVRQVGAILRFLARHVPGVDAPS